jgi:hypothetical protein
LLSRSPPEGSRHGIGISVQWAACGHPDRINHRGRWRVWILIRIQLDVLPWRWLFTGRIGHHAGEGRAEERLVSHDGVGLLSASLGQFAKKKSAMRVKNTELKRNALG